MIYRPHKKYIGQVMDYSPESRTGYLQASDGTQFFFDTGIFDFGGRLVQKAQYVTFRWGKPLQLLNNRPYKPYAKDLEQLA